MNRVLLTGAGFSNNWGGPLAKKVFEHIAFSPEVLGDDALKGIVWRQIEGGFESALEEVQRAALAEDPSAAHRSRLQAFQNALARMFDEFNSVFFEQTEFEFQQYIRFAVRTFLAEIDAIFTLNQDLLLEHHYIDRFDVSLTRRRWGGVSLPGMRRLPLDDPLHHRSFARARWQPLPDAEYAIPARSQPYIKLHGSSNWMSSKGLPLMIMGGDKPGQIQVHKILRRYATEFETRLRQPDTRLVIIGYGFRDHHINRVIGNAVFQHGLKMFIIAPDWQSLSKVFLSPAHPDIALTAFGYDLEAIFRHGLEGASGSPLRETFGGDNVEHRKLMRFLDLGPPGAP